MSEKESEYNQLLRLRGEFFNGLDNLYDEIMADLDQLERDIDTKAMSNRESNDQVIYKEKLANLRVKNV